MDTTAVEGDTTGVGVTVTVGATFLGLPTLRFSAGVAVGLGLVCSLRGSVVGVKKLLIDFWDISLTANYKKTTRGL